ncbi:MAG: DNA-packaging protein [Synergistaceae bacterium]|nr:DNA-packaging protein [Synergistaceae bacterium]
MKNSDVDSGYTIHDLYKYRDRVESVMECRNRIGEYWEVCETVGAPYTFTGLALFLGLTNRNELPKLRKSGPLAPYINAACLAIESYYEIMLARAKNPSGAIFALKNYNWSDTQTVNVQAVDKEALERKANQLAALNEMRAKELPPAADTPH